LKGGIKMNEDVKEMSMKEKIDILFNQNSQASSPNVKIKPIKIPRKAKVRRGRAKKGWIGVIKIDETGVISGEKQKVEDSVFKLKAGTYHATDGQEIFSWEGKFPVIIQETKKLNPVNIVKLNRGENETYRQKYVLTKMLKDAIKIKNGGASFLVWILIAGAIFLGAKYIFKF